MPADASSPDKRPPSIKPERSRRNRNFGETHDGIITAAVRLISESGPEALSMAGIARRMGIDRKTLYYHFPSREALLDSAKAWSSEQLAKGLASEAPRSERTAHISRFVLEHPELVRLWIDDFTKAGDIRARYPEWDALVAGMRANLAHHEPGIDVELYCTIMLTAAFIAPLVFHGSVRPDLTIAETVGLFVREQTRVLAADARLPDETADKVYPHLLK